MSGTLLIMAGGTGGHIMPGLAIARTMQSRGWIVRWLGTRHGLENQLVPQAGIELDTLLFTGLRGKGLLHSVAGVWHLARAWLKSVKLVARIKPNVVLGMGGYVTVPGGFASMLLGRPLVLVNSDARLLLSNRLLAPFAKRILFGLPPARALSRKEIYTGAPVRSEILNIAPPAQRFETRTGPLRILVIGGSLGAAVLNRVIPEAIATLPIAKRPIVVHQAGAAHVAALSERYRALQIPALTLAFIDDMASRYAEADVVICRAGAMTVNELMAAGIASVLVPLTVSTTSHQVDNAQYMAHENAALMVPQTQLNAAFLAELIASLTRDKLLAMAIQAASLGRTDATDVMAQILEHTAGGVRA